MTDKTKVLNELAYITTERARCFMVAGKPFFIYPATLGMIETCKPLMQAFTCNLELAGVAPELEYLRMAADERDKVAALLAYRTCNGKDEVDNTPAIKEKADFFITHMTPENMAEMLAYIYHEITCETKQYEDALGITSEQEWKRKALAAKKDNNSLTFGGVSIYGSLIGHFCKEYGWSYQYVMWGISYRNLKLLAADGVTSVFLTDEERKRCHVPQDRNKVIDLSSKETADAYLHYFDNA